MPIPTTGTWTPADTYQALRSNAAQVKANAQGIHDQLVASGGDTQAIYTICDQMKAWIGFLNTWKAVPGLDAYATSQGYGGTLSADMTTCASAGQACIDWIVANFPTAGGWLQAQSFNPDGTRNQRQFTSAQTAGLQTALTNFIATIS